VGSSAVEGCDEPIECELVLRIKAIEGRRGRDWNSLFPYWIISVNLCVTKVSGLCRDASRGRSEEEEECCC